MLVLLLHALLTAGEPIEPPPACWLRDDPADLELRISPFDSASTVHGADTLKICYSRPRKLDRPIMRRLVPYGEPWRLGANEATAFHTPVPLVIGEAEIPAGSYSLYAIAGPERWQLIVNGSTEWWGVPLNEQVRSADVDTAIAVVEQTSQLVENFTMRFERRSAARVDLVWEWEHTRVRVPIRRSES